MSDISNKLLETHRDLASQQRFDKIMGAWREWRVAIVTAMAGRIDEVGSEHDQELALLHTEFMHCNYVLNALEADPSEVLGVPEDRDGDVAP